MGPTEYTTTTDAASTSALREPMYYYCHGLEERSMIDCDNPDCAINYGLTWNAFIGGLCQRESGFVVTA